LPNAKGGKGRKDRDVMLSPRLLEELDRYLTVIIYYQSERDVLDFVDHELWVDTGDDVRRITFGHILKTTDIRRFPV
jgi:integrase